jgi:uncharacterized metal-binding protein
MGCHIMQWLMLWNYVCIKFCVGLGKMAMEIYTILRSALRIKLAL